MKSERFSFTAPQVRNYKFDLSRYWYVYFDFKDHLTGQVIRRQFRGGINHIKLKGERILAANALKQFWKEKLESGWMPFAFDEPDAVPLIPNLAGAFKYIIEIKSQTLRLKSNQTYKHITKLLMDWLSEKNLLDISLSEFTPARAQQYMDHLLITKKYAGRTFNDHLIILRVFFNCFVERDWVAKNAFRSVKRKTATVGRNHAFSSIEKEKIDNYLKVHDHRLYFLTQIMYHCFIRRTELLCLRVKNIDLVNRTIIISGENAKNNSQETVVIPVGLEPVLMEMNLNKYAPDDFVFGRRLQTSGKRYTNPNHLSTRCSTILKTLEIDSEKGLYSFKHTGVCDYYYATGKDIYSLMRQLRHRSIETSQIYLKSLGLVDNSVFRNALVG